MVSGWVYRPVNHHRRRCLPVIGRRWVVQYAATALHDAGRQRFAHAGRAADNDDGGWRRQFEAESGHEEG